MSTVNRNPYVTPLPGDEFINPHTNSRYIVEQVFDGYYYIKYRIVPPDGQISDINTTNVIPFDQWCMKLMTNDCKIKKLAGASKPTIEEER